MSYQQALKTYTPQDSREVQHQDTICGLLDSYGDALLTRHPVAHLVSSAFVLNQAQTHVLFVHHNGYNKWVWTGGHADGNTNLLQVALTEATEETGVVVTALKDEIAALDIFSVAAHVKNGAYIAAHLHLSVGYIAIADDNAPLRIKPDENSAVQWLPITALNETRFIPNDLWLYHKLLKRAVAWR